MAEDPGGTTTGRTLLIAAVAIALLALLALLAWSFGLFGTGQEGADTYVAEDVVDEGSGEMIVTDPTETGVTVDLPDAPMTPVPPEQTPVATPTPTPTPE
jgi:hypothetical protein